MCETTCGVKQQNTPKHTHREIASPSNMTSAAIIRRIVANRESFAAKHKRKAEAENQYYQQKQAVAFVAEV